MKTFKVYHREYMAPALTGDNLIRAIDEASARKEFEATYPIKVITSIVDCSAPDYQAAYDNEQFDSNGRRKF
jgi:hypothetical protein